MAKRILLVDDAPIIRLMIKDILVECGGYEIVAEGATGKEALDLYKQLKPDLVTMDIVMPEMDGIQALEEILKFDPKAKVVMVTAIDQRESLMKAIRLGATDYIVKPFEADRVMSAVQKALGE
ncbi:MAG: response regulator [Candidatus Omnitrophica bacterium]|nr:response regulator [Candidatus Omnitrophota bacterium]